MCRSMMLFRQFAFFLIAAAFTLPGTASETIELARGSRAERLQQPQLAIDAAGTVHVVYGVGDRVRYHRSQDGGKTFSTPSDLPLVHAMSLGMRRGPRVAATDSAICVTAIGGKQGKGRDGDLLAMQSVDGGKTWSQPIPVNDAPDAAREGLHAMAAGPQGRLCCVWLDLRNRKTEIMAATSSDGGKTWSKNVLVYKSPDGSVCECCHPSVAFDGRGAIYVQWRNSLVWLARYVRGDIVGRRQVVRQGEQARKRNMAAQSLPDGWRWDRLPWRKLRYDLATRQVSLLARQD